MLLFEDLRKHYPDKKLTLVRRCPCCKELVLEENTQEVRKVLFKLPWSKVNGCLSYEDLFRAKYEVAVEDIDAPHYFFRWACDRCLDSKIAILAKTSILDWDGYDDLTYLSYFDSEFLCTDCERNTLFTKEHKKYLYEELRKPVKVIQNRCEECRTVLAEKKKLLKSRQFIQS